MFIQKKVHRLAALGIFILLSFYTSLLIANTNDTQIYIDFMVQKYHFDRHDLQQMFTHTQYDPEVIEKLTHPSEGLPWSQYRSRFLTNDRVQQGVQYWKDHQKALQLAAQRYGVPPAIIVAVIGVETLYGQRQGSYSAFNTLCTLGLHNQYRNQFFKGELTQFLLLTREEHLSPFEVKSSYAGAIGIPQFMPSAYRHYALGYSLLKTPNLTRNHEDAIISIANYLNRNGWTRQQPVAEALNSHFAVNGQLISNHAIPKLSIQQLKSAGVKPSTLLDPHLKAAVIELQGQNQPEYWLTFHNFRVIMSYNPRIPYAMAVYQLSEAIQTVKSRS